LINRKKTAAGDYATNTLRNDAVCGQREVIKQTRPSAFDHAVTCGAMHDIEQNRERIGECVANIPNDSRKRNIE
jgi:hypothetical protein